MIDTIVNKFKTLVELEEFRKIVNEACDKRAEYIELCESAYDLTGKNFGYIKESFENLSPDLFKTRAGKKLINKYTKTIKENKNLSALHSIYESVRKANANTDIEFFTNTLSSSDFGVDKSSLVEDVKSLGMVLAEAYLYLGKDANDSLIEENKNLYNAIEFIASNKVTAKNMAEYGNAIKLIKEDISTRSVLGEKEQEFEDKKGACISNLKEAIEKASDDDKERLMNVMEQLSKKQYSQDTFDDDMQKLNEIEKLF